PGLWSNTCCSHPRPGEDVMTSASRRLHEELGITARLKERFAFTYHARFSNDLQEHEFDHVLFGSFTGKTDPDPAEVIAVRWILPKELSAEIAATPDAFSPWLLICWPQVIEHLQREPILP
ncbi:MAG: NUDIX domain-containing protein, partial [Flavobacteriales bacterium]